jgi:surfactin synthase thioesterase subunit
MEPLIAAVLPELVEQTGKPFGFLGHSTGAIIAFELVRGLQPLGRRPLKTYLSGYPAPCCPRRGPVIHRLPPAELAWHLRRLGGTPREILDDQAAVEFFLKPVRADYEIAETHKVGRGASIRCDLTVFAGTEDPLCSPAAAEAWRAHTSCAFECVSVEGGHFSVQDCRARVAKKILADLTRWRRS